MESRIDYERNLNHTYLVCREMDQENDYELQMLLNNHIPGLLPCKMEKIDGKVDLYYEISSKQPLSRLYEKQKMKFPVLKELFQDMNNAILKMEEFLLKSDELIMNPELIYVDMEKKKFYFCVIPGTAKEEHSLQKLLEFLLECIDYTDEKAVVTAYEWYKKSGEENSSFSVIYRETFELRNNIMEEIEVPEVNKYTKSETESEYKNKEVLFDSLDTDIDKKMKEKPEKNVESMEKITGFIRDKWIVVLLVVIIAVFGCCVLLWKINIEIFKKVILIGIVFVIVGGYIYYNKSRKGDLEEDELDLDELICEENNDEWSYQKQQDTMQQQNLIQQSPIQQEAVYGETVFFRSEQMKEIKKLEPLTSEFPEFTIELFPFILGKLKGAVDGVIEHETVSRIHCKIEFEEGNYYIIDLNSTNGTVVNEDALNTNEKRKLQIGDEVRLGQAVYVFR